MRSDFQENRIIRANRLLHYCYVPIAIHNKFTFNTQLGDIGNNKSLVDS